MVKVITQYDKDLKQKIFALRGEEAYARTTDCVLEELLTNNGERRDDWNSDMYYMSLEFRLNVLRDVGASKVTLFDNDETLGVYPFDTNTGYIDFKYESELEDNRLKLTYDFQHNIYALYNGNPQCLKSKSKVIPIFEYLPHPFTSALQFNNLGANYNTGDPVTFSVSLIADNYLANQAIHIFVDDELVDTLTTDSDGETDEITVSDLSNGLHSIIAVFDGEEKRLENSSVQAEVSVGYSVEMIDYPSVVINESDSTVLVKVTDKLNNPISDVAEVVIVDEVTSEVISEVAYTVDGVATVDGVLISSNPFYARATLNGGQNTSDSITVTTYDDVSISLNVDNTVTSRNYTISGYAQLSEPIGEVTVTDQDGNTYLTDETGKVSGLLYEGSGAGDVTLSASIYGSSDSVVIEDTYQYWNAPNPPMNQNYLCDAFIREYSNGYSISGDNYPTLLLQLDGYDRYYPYSIEFDVVFTYDDDWLAFSNTNHGEGFIQSINNNVRKIKFVRTSSSHVPTLQLFINDRLVQTIPNWNSYAIWFGTGRGWIINNIKVKSVNNE